MKVNIELNAKQIFENHEESEINKCEGEINYHDKGVVLEFTEKYEKEELKFKLTILENKIIINRNNQTMTLEKEVKTKSTVNTPYGEMNMLVTAKQINITKENNKIKNIKLEYEIELENNMKYYNKVNIALMY